MEKGDDNQDFFFFLRNFGGCPGAINPQIKRIFPKIIFICLRKKAATNFLLHPIYDQFSLCSFDTQIPKPHGLYCTFTGLFPHGCPFKNLK